jgi:hypothetical protein
MVTIKTIAIYNSVGHGDYPEDDWTDECEIKGEDDLFEFFKVVHLHDARNRNDYPICSFFNPRKIKFVLVTTEVCNLGHEHNIKTEDRNGLPLNFEVVVSKYEAWIEELKEKRKNDRNKELQERELKELKRLKTKYD